jgi:SpoIID/LytB domain protein
MLRSRLWPALVLLLAAPAPATADPLSRTDRVRLLYSNQFQFGTGGDPVVTVGVMQGQERVRLTSEGAMRLLPDGDGGSEITLPSGTELDLLLEEGDGGQVEYWTVVEHLEAATELGTEAALLRWRDRGFARTRVFETGTVFGVVGRVLDTRDLLVAVQSFERSADAQRLGGELGDRFRLPMTGVQAAFARYPAGLIRATWSRGGSRSDVTVRARDVAWISSDGRHPLLVRDVEHGVGYSWHGRQDRAFAGRLYVIVDRTGKLSLANAVPLDRMLAGIVPSEIFGGAPDAALRAQAVTARGELISKIGHRHHLDPFLVCAEQHCQVYSGLSRETPRTTAAVMATRGQMLFRRGTSTMVESVYSAACGGFSEDNDVVWPSTAVPELRGHIDLDVDDHPEMRRFAGGLREEETLRAWLEAEPPVACARGRFARADQLRWTKTLPAAEVDRMVAARYPAVGRVLALEPDGRGVSGRLRALVIRGERGTARVERELPIRKLFDNLRSAAFVVEALRDASGQPTSFTFRGAGWGHGVGMCQTGAMGMAERGASHEEILRHYFAGSDLGRVY